MGSIPPPGSEHDHLTPQPRPDATDEGEAVVGADLDRLLEATVATVIHSWEFQGSGGIDHLIVGPGGITVVDAQIWSLAPYERDGVIHVGRFNKGPEVQKIRRQCAGVRLAMLHGRPDLRGTDICGVMCLAGEPERRPEPLVGGVICCGSVGAAQIGARAGELTPADVEEVRRTLVAHLPDVDAEEVSTLASGMPAKRPETALPREQPPEAVRAGFVRRAAARGGSIGRRRSPRRRNLELLGAVSLLAVAGLLAIRLHLVQAPSHTGGAPPPAPTLALSRYGTGGVAVDVRGPRGAILQLQVVAGREIHRSRVATDGEREEWSVPAAWRRAPWITVSGCLLNQEHRCSGPAVRVDDREWVRPAAAG